MEIAIEDSSIGNGVSVCDPHSDSASASAFGSNLHIIDWRSHEISAKLLNCHAPGSTIRDIDYNPNKPMSLISCGDDRKVRFWDLRKPSAPVQSLEGHSHWIWSCRYNPFHDQLVLSGGSDHMVNLWRIASVSSAPWLACVDGGDVDSADDGDSSSPGEGGGNRNRTNSGVNNSSNSSHNNNNNNSSSSGSSSDSKSTDPPDVKVRSFDQHVESVYGLAWSAADAWTFASLSVDGKVFVNHVPSTEKYKILL